MSLDEVREGATATEVAANDAATPATAEKPKVTRRRTVKAAEPEGETPKPTRTRSKAAPKAAAEAPVTETSVIEAPVVAAAEPEKKPVRRRTTKKVEDTTGTLPLETPAPVAASAPVVVAPVTAEPVREVPAPKVEAPAEPTPVAVTPQVSAPTAPEAPSANYSAPEAPTNNQNGSSGASYAPTPTPENGEVRAESQPQYRQDAPQQGYGVSAENGNVAPQALNGEGGDGFAPREDGYRNGRMSYRERRALRRNDRLQNRPPRLGPDGQPLPNTFEPRPERPPGEQRFERPERTDRPERQERPERQDRPEREVREPRGERFEARGDRFERQPRRRDLDLQTLEAMGEEELRALCAEMNVAAVTEEGENIEKSALVLALLEAQAQSQNATLKKGILDIINDNKAYLRCDGYHPGETDVYVSNTQIKRFNLKPGDMVLGSARAPKDNERYFGLLRVEAVNGLPVEAIRYRRDFEKLTPIFPNERFVLETGPSNITARIIDLVSPVGKGQRGLIVAPPKAGKTTLIKSIANSITANYPEIKLFVLLIDERPEEVTDISRSVIGEVVASTFDETPDNHMRVAEIVMERAKRLAEMNHDVVILMDSITRLSRASNLVVSPSGRTLSGGLDPAAMYKPKRMFGAARNLEEGGSLTILATALVDTGSRMDEMIFEEFKGTGNMDLVLDRDLFNQRIFPAIDINRSGTRRDDLLMSADELTATYHLRRTLAQLDNDKAVTLLIDRLKNTKSNGHFMEVVAKSARQQQNGAPTT